MERSLPGPPTPGLERSCASAPVGQDWIRAAPDEEGLERIEAAFAGPAFAPHRHDSYAIGVTTRGVQAFGYRGARHLRVPGEAVVLHPDELHDGYAGAEGGFAYRILYVAPALIREALGDRGALPFVRADITRDPPLLSALTLALADLSRPLEPLERDALLAALADSLTALSGEPSGRESAIDRPAMDRARELLDAAEEPPSSEDLEQATGLDRFALARQFRRCWGTSPHRYHVLRRLERARTAMADGESLASAAALCGFADQAHLTRQFKRAYGMTPGRWRRLASQTNALSLPSPASRERGGIVAGRR